MQMNEKKFNHGFNLFILIGMTVAVACTTAFKFSDVQGTARMLLLVSAFGSLMGVLSAVSSANGKIITFLFGLLDVSIYGAVCLVNWRDGGPGLGNALLHFLYFVPMQFVGFVQWRRRGNDRSGSVKARRLKPRGALLFTLAFLLGTAVAYLILLQFDRSGAETFLRWAVLLDALPLVCNILGQMLMSTAYAEQWIFWLGVNIFSIAMWSVSLAAHPDSSYALIYIIKYCFYLANSSNGLRIWLALSRQTDSLDK
jgi:nicotinamide mononucleotide transporter